MAPQCASITWTVLSHLCGTIWSNTLAITCPTGTPLCIITGADTPIQHHHGVCHYDNADHTQHCCQEQFHWRWGHKWNLTVGDTTTHRFNAHYRALPTLTTVCQQRLTMSINSFKMQGTRTTNQSDTLMTTFQRVPPSCQLSTDLNSFVFIYVIMLPIAQVVKCWSEDPEENNKSPVMTATPYLRFQPRNYEIKCTVLTTQLWHLI